MSNILSNNEEELVGCGTYKYPYTITKRKYTNYNVYTIRCTDIDGCFATGRTIESAMVIFKSNVDTAIVLSSRCV